MLKAVQIPCKVFYTDADVKNALIKKLHIRPQDLKSFRVYRRSLDARKKPDLLYSLTVLFELSGEAAFLSKCKKDKRLSSLVSSYEPKTHSFSICGEEPLRSRPVIIGTGPAGLFCGYVLAKAGLAPLLLERGACVEERTEAVERFWKTGELDPSCNVQFGEGGAGTFSDGKLNTQTKDMSGFHDSVTETFISFGAPEEIAIDQKPHIGTDRLKTVVSNMRREIENLGGEVRFHSLVTDLVFDETDALSEVVLESGERIPAQAAVLAIGHSARDTFAMLTRKPVPMEPKPFAVGFRVIHPQMFINASQYGEDCTCVPGPAPYKLTAKADDGRGVYTFCMCPGGYVVNASSEPEHLAVNGMSYLAREGKFANSAVIVTVTPEDAIRFTGEAEDSLLAGMHFQRLIEARAYEAGQGKIPYCTFGEFENRVLHGEAIEESSEAEIPDIADAVKGSCKKADLTTILPETLNLAFVQGLHSMNRSIPGFSNPDTGMFGVESRTSSPLRIIRDDAGRSSATGIYPCGEGAGYAGGIMSAAMDGVKTAQQILQFYKKEY